MSLIWTGFTQWLVKFFWGCAYNKTWNKKTSKIHFKEQTFPLKKMTGSRVTCPWPAAAPVPLPQASGDRPLVTSWHHTHSRALWLPPTQRCHHWPTLEINVHTDFIQVKCSTFSRKRNQTSIVFLSAIFMFLLVATKWVYCKILKALPRAIKKNSCGFAPFNKWQNHRRGFSLFCLDSMAGPLGLPSAHAIHGFLTG